MKDCCWSVSRPPAARAGRRRRCCTAAHVPGADMIPCQSVSLLISTALLLASPVSERAGPPCSGRRAWTGRASLGSDASSCRACRHRAGPQSPASCPLGAVRVQEPSSPGHPDAWDAHSRDGPRSGERCSERRPAEGAVGPSGAAHGRRWAAGGCQVVPRSRMGVGGPKPSLQPACRRQQRRRRVAGRVPPQLAPVWLACTLPQLPVLLAAQAR